MLNLKYTHISEQGRKGWSRAEWEVTGRKGVELLYIIFIAGNSGRLERTKPDKNQLRG